MNRLTTMLLVLAASLSVFAEEEVAYNPIPTTVTFLTISPESRGSAMGDVGAATSPGVYAQYWNPAKYAFIDDQFGLGLSYTPWLRALVNDIGLINVNGYYRFDDLQTISSSLRFFSMGEIQGTGHDGEKTVTIEPTEFALDLGYARKFSERWSGAVLFRYIRSDIYKSAVDGVSAANAFAVDIAAYYTNRDVYIADYSANYAFGLNISNLGSKISYNEKDRLFLPANLKLGASLGLDFDSYNAVSLSVDANKLLVPTPPLDYKDAKTDYNEIGSLEGAIKSFSDAPGGFREEMQEIMLSAGLEYAYDETFFVRGGYFYEHENKGNREFFSIGAGFKMNVFALDVSYLVPRYSSSPLANTLRFSLSFGVDGLANIFGN